MHLADTLLGEVRLVDMCVRLAVFPSHFKEVGVAVHCHEADILAAAFLVLLFDQDSEDAVLIFLRMQSEGRAVRARSCARGHRRADEDEVAPHPSRVGHLEGDCDRAVLKAGSFEVV